MSCVPLPSITLSQIPSIEYAKCPSRSDLPSPETQTNTSVIGIPYRNFILLKSIIAAEPASADAASHHRLNEENNSFHATIHLSFDSLHYGIYACTDSCMVLGVIVKNSKTIKMSTVKKRNISTASHHPNTEYTANYYR